MKNCYCPLTPTTLHLSFKHGFGKVVVTAHVNKNIAEGHKRNTGLPLEHYVDLLHDHPLSSSSLVNMSIISS
jgi:hypothetical protein